MADLSQRVMSFKEVPLGFDERRHLEQINDVNKDDVDYWARQVFNNQAVCAAVEIDGRRVGTMIYCFENEGHPVFVCNALFCEPDSTGSYIAATVDRMEAFAIEQGAKVARFYTRRVGLEHVMQLYGYDRRVMMEKNL